MVESRREHAKSPLVAYLDQTPALRCPYGQVRRIVTGGAGGVANVHVVSVTQGTSHLHRGYDEIYYVLSGHGMLTLGDEQYRLQPGAVAVIPAGLPHALKADADEMLEFIIFGTPPMSIDDDRARPIGE